MIKTRAIPFVHGLVHARGGKIAYVSGIGIRDDADRRILQELVGRMISKAKKDGCSRIAWLTGKKSKHDKIETGLLVENGSVKNASRNGKPTQTISFPTTSMGKTL